VAGALEGIRVIDFSRVLAGPLATMVFADLGAEVIKVERPGTGDDTREWGPPYDPSGVATYFLSVNRGKSSRALDLRDEAGAAEARELVAGADVLVENFRPGVMERLGLGYADLSRETPGLVYCSLTGFGSGEGAALPGYDLLVQAVGGLMSVTGDPEGDPQKVGVALVDVVAGLFASTGILAALRHRDRTGEGQLVEVDLLSALLAALVHQSSAYTAGGVIAGRMGNAHPSISPYELYETSDGEIVIAVGNDKQFAALAELVGAPEWAADERFGSNDARVTNRLKLRDLLQEKLGARPGEEWIAAMSEAGVPAGRVNDIAGAFELAESLGLDPIAEVPRSDGTAVRLPRNPIRLSATPAAYPSAPPALDDE
jgi:crotonobetainyl-CoA:carnitine CoA-transferase CaiB-like acyl-CoA transferase